MQMHSKSLDFVGKAQDPQLFQNPNTLWEFLHRYEIQFPKITTTSVDLIETSID